jgi:hypothetical protein
MPEQIEDSKNTPSHKLIRHHMSNRMSVPQPHSCLSVVGQGTKSTIASCFGDSSTIPTTCSVLTVNFNSTRVDVGLPFSVRLPYTTLQSVIR